MEHYIGISYYVSCIHDEIQVDIVTCFPKIVPFPKVNLDTFLRQVESDIITMLTYLPPTTAPSLEAGYPTRDTLPNLA